MLKTAFGEFMQAFLASKDHVPYRIFICRSWIASLQIAINSFVSPAGKPGNLIIRSSLIGSAHVHIVAKDTANEWHATT